MNEKINMILNGKSSVREASVIISFKNYFRVRIYIFISSVLIILSCADENNALVNQKSFSETVKIRFINFTEDGKSRQLGIEGRRTALAVSGNCSAIINPPADSGYISIYWNDIVEYKLFYKQRFIRNITYSYIALPSPDNSPNKKPLDTVISLTTSTSIQPNAYDSYLKFVNAYPDSTLRYSLRLGCPNGEPLSQYQLYRSISELKTVKAGEITVSIIRHSANKPDSANLFELELAAAKQYAIIVHRSVAGAEEFLLLDQQDGTSGALNGLIPLSQRLTNLRAINLSGENVMLKKLPDEIVVPDIAVNQVTEFKSISACSSSNLDTICALDIPGSITYSTAASSLNVGSEYSVLIFDSADIKAGGLMIIPPAKIYGDYSDRASIRFVHASYSYGALNFSLGAKISKNDSIDFYTSGEDVRLNYKDVSEPFYIETSPKSNKSPVPLLIISDENPSKLLFCTYFELEKGKKYLLIVINDADGKEKVSVIEDEASTLAHSVNYLGSGVFTQIVHAVAGLSSISINLSNVLSSAQIFYTETIASVVNEGSNTTDISGKSLDFNAEASKRVLIVATGDESNIEIFPFIDLPMGAKQNNVKFRFINACKDVASMTIKFNSDTSSVEKPVAQNIQYGQSSQIGTSTFERNVSIFFIDEKSGETKLRVDEIPLKFGKNVSIIFTGKNNIGYSAIIQQEF